MSKILYVCAPLGRSEVHPRARCLHGVTFIKPKICTDKELTLTVINWRSDLSPGWSMGHDITAETHTGAQIQSKDCNHKNLQHLDVLELITVPVWWERLRSILLKHFQKRECCNICFTWTKTFLRYMNPDSHFALQYLPQYALFWQSLLLSSSFSFFISKKFAHSPGGHRNIWLLLLVFGPLHARKVLLKEKFNVLLHL